VYSAAYPHPRDPEEVLELVGLTHKRNEPIKSLSGGQRRRLDLALGIAGDPELLFLDEPTAGFDPSARRRSWELVQSLRTLGKTILLTTHYMDEAQHLADRVAVIAAGRIVAAGAPETIGGRTAAKTVVAFQVPDTVDLASLPLPVGAVIHASERRILFDTETPTRDLARVLGWVADHGEELQALTVSRPTLEDIYLQLTDETEEG
jgi:ABC-2 type transport system ATP-binding protein